jgi:hypothetical protein
VSRRRAGRRVLAPIVAALVAATVGAGCHGPPPRPPGPATPTPSGQPAESPSAEVPSGRPADPLAGGGLLLLAGRPGAMGLERISDDGRSPLALPDPDVAWISTDRTGRVLATTRHGRAFLSDPIAPGRAPAWRRLVPTGLGPTTPAAPLAFGTLTEDGSRAAFIAADFRTGLPFDVVIVETAGGAATDHPVPRPADGAPPAWFGVRLVVLTRERGDAAGATILDPATDRLTDGPGPPGPSSGPAPAPGWSGSIAALSVAADGSRLAVGATGDGRIEIHPAGPWLARAATPPAVVVLDPDADRSRGFAWLALAPDGDRLAVVRTDADGDAVVVAIRRASDEWRAALRMTLPAGAIRAVVAWLP